MFNQKQAVSLLLTTIGELYDKSEYSGEDQDDGPSEFAAKGLSSQLSKSVKMLAGTSKVDNVF
jgi:hypothetical protein